MNTKQLVRAGILSCIMLLTTFLSHAQFKVIGYMPSWQGNVNSVQYSKLTHINYAFLLPNADGSLQAIDQPGKLSSLVSLAHANGVKVLISVGGWNDGNDSGFETLASSSSGRTNFTTNIMNFVNQYNLDGADIDWEYPDAGASANNYVALMTQLATALHAQGKLLTAAVVGTGGDGVLASVFSQVDFLNLMAYDYNNYDHSTYTYATQSISYWKNKGLPASKCNLGVPFYGRPSWETYAALIARGADPYSDTYQGVGYNGITTIKAKVDLAYDQGGGIMMWELSQDATGTYSLLSAIHDEVLVKSGGNTGNKAPTASITSPANGATYSAGATVSITATAADADGSVTKVEFYNGGTKLGEATSSPYTYSWTNVASGTYNLTAKATDNSGATGTSATVTITVGSGTGTGCSGVQTWTASGVYTGGTQVVYNNKLYTAKWWTQNEQPDTHTGDGQVWTYVSDCGGTTTPGNSSPAVSISSPAGGASYTAPASVTISATATDSDGSITKVEFYNGGTKLGEATSSPYSYTWTSVAAGTYSLTAKATDNGGASTTSGAVSITVTGGSTGTGNCAGVATYAPYPAVYNIGDKVVYNGYLYQSLANGLYNVTPGTADYWWQPLGACTSSAAKVATVAITHEEVPAVAGAVAVYPNPVTGSTVQVKVRTLAAEKLYLDVYSVDGNGPVARKVYTAGGKGEQLISVDISKVPAGSYIIQISNSVGTRKESVKLIRM